MKVCLPEEVIFLEAFIINDISSLSGMWKHFRVTSSAILFTIETQRATTLCLLLVEVTMGASGSGIHEIYFPGARGLGIHEILSSWHVTFFNSSYTLLYLWGILICNNKSYSRCIWLNICIPVGIQLSNGEGWDPIIKRGYH
jgi:hypothetical protein